MPNTYTDLVNDSIEALRVVSQENAGFVTAVARSATADRLPKGATFRVPYAPAAAAQDRVVGMAFPTAAYQDIANVEMTITNDREVPFSWTGDDEANLNQGPGFLTIRQNQIAEAIRELRNEMAGTIATVARKGASRAYGTAGTTPFASDLSATARAKQILDDNGAAKTGRRAILSSDAAANILSLPQFTNANQKGDTNALLNGELGRLHGFTFGEDANLTTVTKGTGASYLSDTGTTYAVGETTIHVDTGTGTILAGDVVTFAGDTNKYVVKTGFAGDGDGDIVLHAPGLRATLANNVAMTIGNNFTPSICFPQSAILLAARLPHMPAEGDSAKMAEVLVDPVTGINMELRVYPGKGMNTYCLAACWSAVVVKPNDVAMILG